jgi:hypothetical protein
VSLKLRISGISLPAESPEEIMMKADFIDLK